MEIDQRKIYAWFILALTASAFILFLYLGRDWIAGNGLREFAYYSKVLLKAFLICCVACPCLDITLFFLKERMGYNNDEDVVFGKPQDMYSFTGYKNGICPALYVFTDDFSDKKRLIKKYTYFNTKGEKITDDLFDVATEFTDKGYGQVYRNGKYNMIDREGKYLCDEWYSGMSMPDDDGYIKVVNDEGLTNFVDYTGKLMWAQWKKEFIDQN